MIGPGTRVFGLVTHEPQAEAWLARLYNYLYGYNGLDAAYVRFTVRPEVLGAVLTGFVQGKKAEHLHVSPSLQQEAARWAHAPHERVDAFFIGADVSAAFDTEGPPEWSRDALAYWVKRATDELTSAFGRAPAVPPDLAEVLREEDFRPCKLMHDDFREHYEHLRTV